MFLADMLSSEDNQSDELALEAVYAADVLCLGVGETEELLDGRVFDEAQRLAINIEVLSQDEQPSTRGPSPEPRCDVSIESGVSKSTAPTSHASGSSKGHKRGRASRTSWSFRGHLLDHKKSSESSVPRHSSPASLCKLTSSLPQYSSGSSTKRRSRVLQGLSFLKFIRTESSSWSNDRSVHDQKTSTTRNVSAARPERDDLAAVDAGREDNIAVNPSSRPFISSDTRSMSNQFNVDSALRRASVAGPIQLKASSEFSQFRKEADELQQRFTAWVEQRRSLLDRTHQELKTTMRTLHDATVQELIRQHEDDLIEAEDTQVRAEAEMHKLHTREKIDNATALKHIEAYCSGRYTSGETRDRVVTTQDLIELEKTRRARDCMPTKHASYINVLRGEQSRRMRLRAQRQEQDLEKLKRMHLQEEMEQERCHTAEAERMEDFFVDKRRRMRRRLEMQMAILAKKLQHSSGGAPESSTSCFELDAVDTQMPPLPLRKLPTTQEVIDALAS